MDIIEQEEVFNQFVGRMKELMMKKGNDYAGDDRLSNFKIAGQTAGGTAAINCMNLIGTKVARLGNIINRTTEFESAEDTLIDLANYCVLMTCILKEEDKKPKVKYEQG